MSDVTFAGDLAVAEKQAVGGSTGPAVRRVRGSTTIVELLRRHPDGSAARLLAALNVPCAHCGGAFHEPLTLAARRHHRDAGAFLRACQA
ncbi:MAG: hypothetical protein ACRDYY_06490, partial [Acidimicrobiales bacterium]